MVHHWTRKAGREYRYYTCSRTQKLGRTACSTGSIPAIEIEDFVVERIAAIGADPGLQRETFRQVKAQARAERRALAAEAGRLERDLAALRRETEGLVGQLASATAAATAAVTAGIEEREQRRISSERRLAEVRQRLVELDAERIEESDLSRALRDFAPLWEVLTVPERERVIRMLIERIDYDGRDGSLRISYRLAGLAHLAAEVATEEAS
jgi:site-specific DNA recombinase